jgi:rhomboid protease GluP
MVKFKTRKARVTHLIIIINIAFFAVENSLGGSQNIENLERLGALIPQQVFTGEWWRLVSANFLHYDWLHLSSNMIALYFVGSLVELNFGKLVYIFIYLCSGISSMLSFSLFILFAQGNLILIGASASIMGLVGTILAIFFRLWLKEKSKKSIYRLISIFLMIIIQFIFDFLLPQVSFFSHLFGLIWGFILGLIVQIFLKSKRLIR